MAFWGGFIGSVFGVLLLGLVVFITENKDK